MKKKQRRDYSTFHLLNFLNDHGIAHKSSGKNIGAGWIGIESCPFCTGGGYHFAIHAMNKTGNCWICGETCDPVGAVAALLGCDRREAYRTVNQYDSADISWIPEQDSTGNTVIFPDSINRQLSEGAREYLWNRKYDPDRIIEKYKIRSTDYGSTLEIDGREWDFGLRIVAPVFINRKIECYVARDFSGVQEPKYMNSPVVASKTSPHKCIYNYDTLSGKIIIVEGITDVWRMGAKTGAFLGITFTKEQVALLSQKKVSKAVILFDSGADKRAQKLANALSMVIDEVQIAYLDKGDPGKLEQDEAYKIKYQLIGEI